MCLSIHEIFLGEFLSYSAYLANLTNTSKTIYSPQIAFNNPPAVVKYA